MSSEMRPHVPVLPPPAFFFAVSGVLGLFFALWSWFVFTSETIPAFDRACAQFWHDESGNHQLWQFMVYMTDAGGVMAMTIMAGMGAIWQNAIRHRLIGIAWLCIVLAGGLFTLTTKPFFDRPRPPVEWRDRAVLEANESYPSGHSMGSAIGYGMLAYALILPQQRRPRRIVTLILLSCLVVTIGFSRIYLRAHWFSDVVGGWTLGLAWLFFCLGWLERRRRRVLSSQTNK